MPDDIAAKHITRQLIRAATGGGSNYEEARGAESRADFIHKVGVANKEVREALYWLRLAKEAEVRTGEGIERLVDEADQLVAILTSSIRTAKLNESRSGARESYVAEPVPFRGIGNREPGTGVGNSQLVTGANAITE